MLSSPPRLLPVERLAFARSVRSLEHFGARSVVDKLEINNLDYLLQQNQREGTLIGTVGLLYKRPDLRIRVEATLSQLLSRNITLEVSDGRIFPQMRYESASKYQFYDNEAHGVLELVVLLANIYDEETKLLLIDEPELNLHPQYQAFILNEIKRTQNKRFMIATHSPIFLDLQTINDLEGVFAFHPDFRVPTRYKGSDYIDREVQAMLPRMNEQHKAFFFAQKPIFVEGYFDSAIFSRLISSLGRSVEAAGSCLIPAEGKDDASRYLMLCNEFGKEAFFIFDLDAIFDPRLSKGANQNEALATRIAERAQGDFDKLKGQLQQYLGETASLLEKEQVPKVPEILCELIEYLQQNKGPNQALDKRRLAVLTVLYHYEDALSQIVPNKTLVQVKSHFRELSEHLRSVNIFILPGGALENHLPAYKGSMFKVDPSKKKQVTDDELLWLAETRSESELRDRYSSLVDVALALPAKAEVDIIPVLKRELADVLHHLIKAIRDGQICEKEDVPSVLGNTWTRVSNFVQVEQLDVNTDNGRPLTSFNGKLRVLDKFSVGERTCAFNQTTQTNAPASLILIEV